MYNFELEIGQRIKKLRIKSGYTREQLSEMAEISSKFLYEIESGIKGMSAYTLYNLSSALNVTCDYILKGCESNSDLEYIDSMLLKMSPDELAHIEQIIKHVAELIKIKDK